jgi:hypothetical protein
VLFSNGIGHTGVTGGLARVSEIKPFSSFGDGPFSSASSENAGCHILWLFKGIAEIKKLADKFPRQPAFLSLSLQSH